MTTVMSKLRWVLVIRHARGKPEKVPRMWGFYIIYTSKYIPEVFRHCQTDSSSKTVWYAFIWGQEPPRREQKKKTHAHGEKFTTDKEGRVFSEKTNSSGDR